MDGHRLVRFETLRGSSFKTMLKTMFQTIRFRAHRSSFPDPALSNQSTLTLSRIEPAEKFQVGYVVELWNSSPRPSAGCRHPQDVKKF